MPSRCLPPSIITRILGACAVLAGLAVVPSALHAADYLWDSVAIGGGGFVSALIPSQTQPGLLYARTDVGGAYRWDASAANWIPLNDWTRREDVGYLGVESLALDPQNPERLYLLVGTSYFSNGRSAILRSDDYGQNFETIEVTGQFRAHGNGMGRQNGKKLQVDPKNSDILYCGTRSHGLFKSHDRGSSWSRLDALEVTTTSSGNGISFVTLDPSSGDSSATQTLYVGVSREGDNLYRSTDGGATFTPVAGGPASLMPQRGVLAPNGVLHLIYGNGAGPHATGSFDFNQGGIWKLDTNNDSWSDITPSGFSNAFGGISVDPKDPDRIIASSINLWWPQDNAYGDRFFLSNDGGTTWTDLVERGFDLDPQGITWIDGQSIHWAGSIEFDPFDTNVAWVTSGNGIYRCDNLSATESVWKFAVRGLEETVPLDLVSIPDGPLVSVIGDYDGFRHTEPKAYAPVHRPGMGTTTGLAYASADPQWIYRVGDSLYYSQDYGLTWTESASMNGTKGSLALSADAAVLLHCPENSATTYRSTDQGSTWSTASGLSLRNARPIADPVDPDTFYAYGNTSLYRSTDGGASFAPAANNLPSGGQSRLAIALGHAGHLWFAHSSQGLYRSTDAGDSVSRLDSVTAARAVGTGKAAPDSDYPTLFIWGTVDGVEGIFRSTDQGASWLRVNDDAHQYGGPGNGQFLIGDQNVFGRVYMSTAGRGIVFGEPVLDSIAYADWSALVFTEAQRADPEIAGEEADPDGDGLGNLLEWILQTDPLAPTDLAARTFAFSAAAPRIAFQQLAEFNSATLAVEISTDLQSWSDIASQFVEEASSPAAKFPTRTRIFSPASGAFPETLFLRFTATR